MTSTLTTIDSKYLQTSIRLYILRTQSKQPGNLESMMYDIWSGEARAAHLEKETFKVDMLYLTSCILLANAFAPHKKKILMDFLYEMASRQNPDPERKAILLPGYPLHAYPEDIKKDLDRILSTPISNFGLFGSIPEKIEVLTKRLEAYADELFKKREKEDVIKKHQGQSLKKAMEEFLNRFPEYQIPDPELKPQAFVANKAAERLLNVMVQIIRICHAITPPSKDDIYHELTDGVDPKDPEYPYDLLIALGKDNRYHWRSPNNPLWLLFQKNGLTGALEIHKSHFEKLKNSEFRIINFVPLYEIALDTTIKLNDYAALMGLYNTTTTFTSLLKKKDKRPQVWPNLIVKQVCIYEDTVVNFLRQATPQQKHLVFSESYLNPYRVLEDEKSLTGIGRLLGSYLMGQKIAYRLYKKVDESMEFDITCLPMVKVTYCPLSLTEIRSQQTFRAYDSISRALDIVNKEPKRDELPYKGQQAETEVRGNEEILPLVAPRRERQLRALFAERTLQNIANLNKSQRKLDLVNYFESEEFTQVKRTKLVILTNFQLLELECTRKAKDKLLYLLKYVTDQEYRSKMLCELLYQDTGQSFFNSGLTFKGQRENIWIQPYLNNLQHLSLETFYKIYNYNCFPTSVPKDVRKVWTALVTMMDEEEKKRHAPNVLKCYSIKKWDVCYESILSLIPTLHYQKNYGSKKALSINRNLIPLPSMYLDKNIIKVSKGKLSTSTDASFIFGEMINQFKNIWGVEEINTEKNEREEWEENLRDLLGTSVKLLNKKSYSRFLDWALQTKGHGNLFKKVRISLKREISQFFKKLNWNWILFEDEYCRRETTEKEDFGFENPKLINPFPFGNRKKKGKTIPVFVF